MFTTTDAIKVTTPFIFAIGISECVRMGASPSCLNTACLIANAADRSPLAINGGTIDRHSLPMLL